LILSTTRVSVRDATKEYNKLLCRRRCPDGILTSPGTTTVSDVVKPSTNQLIDLGASTNQWKTFYQRRGDFRNAERDRDEYSDRGCDHLVDPRDHKG
jgi:hypothetical protein